MNIDPKSETQKPDFKLAAFDYVQKNFVRNSAEAQQQFIAGADHGYSLLQSENQRLTEENKNLQENYEGMKSHCSHLTQINVANMAFDKADDGWREQHKVEDGEDFIHWFMRLHAVEKDDLEIERDRLTKINEELVSFLEEMQDSNYPGCNHTIPGQWKTKGKELIEKSKPMNHEQS